MNRREFAAIALQPEEMNRSWRAKTHLMLALLVAVLLALSASAAEQGAVDRIVVDKAQRRMDLMSGETVVRSYKIALGSAPEGDKQQEGDGKTPEGKYVIEGRNPSSAFHLSLKISYPDAADRAAAAACNVSPGGDIFIHGAPNGWMLAGQPPGDWTRGCIAVTKAEIEEIWRLVPDGTPVEIRP
jgi:murein L,D-transpeptidase YafK